MLTFQTGGNMLISAIVAMTENRVIGLDNRLPWHLPADLRYFKKITLHKTIVMGRKTFASIGRPLPERLNIILTRDPTFKATGCTVLHSLNEIFLLPDQNEIIIIGGSELFKQSLHQINRLYLTLIHTELEGDTFFPELKTDEWVEVSRQRHRADGENPYDYSFIIFDRI